MPAAAFSQIGQIASMRRVHEAFQWLHLHEPQIMRWQVELVNIPAPPFAERRRAEWLIERFRELGLSNAHLDEAGNALATLPGRACAMRRRECGPGMAALPGPNEGFTSNAAFSRLARVQPLVLLSAHIDTVFPQHTLLAPVLEGSRLAAPGACDNGAGVVALLALAAALTRTGLEPDEDILFAGNVGEEGEGDLRGMRHIYASPCWRDRIGAHLVLDGAGHEIAVTAALGSRRFEVVLDGAGGHSWTDVGRPNPITTLSEAIAGMNRLNLRESRESMMRGGACPADTRGAPIAGSESAPGKQVRPESSQRLVSANPAAGCEMHATAHPAPSLARSAWNVGTIEGGASVNSIPEQARARFDLRSTDPEQLVRLEVQLHRVVEDAVLSANAAAEAQGVREHPLSFTIAGIGSRPAGALPQDARILGLLQAVDRHLNLRTECRTASTDANIPLSLGVEAISIGAGGDGGGIHTRGEWYDARGRDLGLRRVLLLLLALASASEKALAAD
jgi:acetylornithine deacetylase/succinyl-diaminopimelate desuccinylase-like protein